MQAMESGQFALPSPNTKMLDDASKSEYSVRQHSPASSKASSDTISPDKEDAVESDDIGIAVRDSRLDEVQHAIDSLRISTPTPSRGYLASFDSRKATTPIITPSKNNLGTLLKEMQARREENKVRNRTTSSMSQSTSKSSATQVRHSPISMRTPRKSSSEKDSPRGNLMSLLSPRSTKTNRSFSPAEFFGARTPPRPRREDDGDEIVGDLEFLRSQPPPDLSQHPVMAADPFTSRSTAPSMSTHMSISQTRQWAIEHYREKKERWEEKQVRPFVKGEPFPIFKQPEWIATEEERAARQVAEAKRKASQGTNQEVLTSQASPIPKNSKTPKTPLRIDTKAANSPTTDIHAATKTATPLTDEISRKSGSAGIRSLSNLFKSRSSSDRLSLSSSAQEALSPEEKREESLARKVGVATSTSRRSNNTQERYLRTITNCPSFDYNPTSVYPRHPNTGRDWRSRNLRCAGCQWITCTVCGRACCARAACFYAIENHKESLESLERAKEIKEMIEHIIPTNTEVQTFLTCTSCKKEVCPDCCGVCPNEACQDIQCRRCKRRDPWDECDWHKGMMMGEAEKSVVGRTRSTI